MSRRERKRLTVGDLIELIGNRPKDAVLITSAGAIVRVAFTPEVKGNGGIPFPATLEFQTEDDL